MPRTATPRALWLTAALATLVVMAAVSTVLVLRHNAERRSGDPQGNGPAAGSTPSSECGDGPCHVVDSVPLNGTVADLLTGPDGKPARLRVGPPASPIATVEVTITAMDIRLGAGSLRCLSGPLPACLVRAPLGGGMVGEVFVGRGGTWRVAERPYLSDAGSVTLGRVTGDAPEVIVVRHDCAAGQSAASCQVAPVVAEVFDLAARPLGCTRQYASPGKLPGWPDVQLTATRLRPCP